MKLGYNPRKHTIFAPINKEKYIDKNPIVCRSSWERKFCEWCDRNVSVVKWASEAISIEYYDPVKRKKRRYFPDFLLLIRDKDGKETSHLIEIKPHREVVLPVKSKNKSEKTLMTEIATHITNTSKWKAAALHCKKHNINFRILTEKDLFIKDAT